MNGMTTASPEINTIENMWSIIKSDVFGCLGKFFYLVVIRGGGNENSMIIIFYNYYQFLHVNILFLS